jgi:hypothetical protein
MISEQTSLLLLALKETKREQQNELKKTRSKSRSKKKSSYCSLSDGEKSIYFFDPSLIGTWAPLSASRKSKNLSRYVDENVKSIISSSLVYKHLKNSRDKNLADISLSTCATNILCYLKTKKEKSHTFTHKELIDIAKLAAQEMLKQNND